MTDRHAGYIVTLDRDIREDDAESTIAALRQIRGVLSVEPVRASPETMMAESRAVHSMRMSLYKFLETWKP